MSFPLQYCPCKLFFWILSLKLSFCTYVITALNTFAQFLSGTWHGSDSEFVPGQKREGGGQAAMSPAMRPWSHAPPHSLARIECTNKILYRPIVLPKINYAIEIILFVKPNSVGEKHWLNLSLRAGVVKNQDTLGGPSIWPSKFHVWCPYITNDISWKLLCSSFANIIYKVAKIDFF